MDDSCAVCADALEWVAYGPCGHREVCSTCVVRLRFVLGDRRCCICKTESPFIFVTKALGDYTRVVSDFSVFPENPSEGQVGKYLYHEDTQAFFDDVDHYRMIKAMCRLSCSVCDKSAGEQGSESTKRRHKFRGIEQLKGHLFHAHKLFMCSLCLEGRKVFICEQKLYTRSQLTQHIRSGDSEVDGSESERGGFMGHPLCEFCRNPFYGDNELYMHMSREHFTCHICQRQHPGQYDHYKNYDDLEVHFRQEHFLCEDEACLSKKFVVFQSEAEMKRHNAIEHGGRMSRSKRNAILQIPTSFRYRRNEEEQRRRRGRGSRPESSDDQLLMAVRASLDSAVVSGRISEFSVAQPVTEDGETSHGNDSVRGSLESLTITSGPEVSSRSTTQSSRATLVLEESSFPSLVDRELPEPSSRYAQALCQNSSGARRLEEASFPPLPGANSNLKSAHGLESHSMNTLAARLQQCNRGAVMTNSSVSRPSGHPEITPSTSQVRAHPSHRIALSSSSSQATVARKPLRENGILSPLSTNPAWNLNNTNMMKHSASAPNLAEAHLPNQAVSTKFSAMNANQQPTKNQPLPNVADFHAANKSLVERIRVGLGMDEGRYAAFKSISAEYRQGLIDTYEYLSYVEQFGLSHLVPELAQLCPDAQKQKELIDAYNASIRHTSLQENVGSSRGSLKEGKLSKKGKGKGVAYVEDGSVRGDALADSFLDTVRRLQLSIKPHDDNLEVLSKDGYRSGKGKLPLPAREAAANSSSADMNSSQISANGANQISSSGGKQRKKTSKFTRVRLGDGSAAALLDLSRANASPESSESEAERPSEGLRVRGAWHNGGSQRLFAK